METTDTTRVVTVDLDARKQSIVKVGEKVETPHPVARETHTGMMADATQNFGNSEATQLVEGVMRTFQRTAALVVVAATVAVAVLVVPSLATATDSRAQASTEPTPPAATPSGPAR